ncbi:E3 ubiquitin-protein ligase rnf213-alpha-like, partial [Saccostrea cucullata]|uniref:E3 ubiquitin-protein ligase rnf213-alpha-like n=1 Tax=Saccostrea cuccullata TaxID=36930 RepID=UPI002ED350E4
MLRIRFREYFEFRERISLVSTYVQLCTDIAEEAEASSLLLRDCRKISDVCEPLVDVNEGEEWRPRLNVFKSFSDSIEKLRQLKRLQNVNIFKGIWNQEGKILKKEYGRKLSVDEVFNHLWRNVVEDFWEPTVDGLKKGKIEYQTIQRYFGVYSISEIQKMLESIPNHDENDRGWISERLKQIEDHRFLERSLAAAEAISSLVKTYKLQGDFTSVQNIIQKVSFKGLWMMSIEKNMQVVEESLKNICTDFQSIDDRKLDCLQAFIECNQLVFWIKKSMKDVKELKVFVDLASISAGEGDMEVAKVKCLHAATTGYAPLIFNLEKINDYDLLFKFCAEVWKEMDADMTLPEKLRGTNKHFEWLESVKKAQGAVEITSMKQVEDINERGTYVIGRINENAHAKILKIDDVLELHITKEDGNKELLSFKELQELQGKLMLVAGKAEHGKDEVERFIMILDSAIRLSRVYISLLAAGCVLFTNWKATFFCDPRCHVCAIIQFENAEQGQQRGRRNQKEDVSTVIPKLANFMEKCLEDWLQYIAEKREKYRQLNFFTIDQLVFLQKELVRSGTEKTVSNLIYPLLSIIKNNCSPADVIEAMKKAKAEVRKKGVKDIKTTEDEKKRKFIEKMTKIGFHEDLALEALDKGGIRPTDEAEGIKWCLQNRRRFEIKLRKKENDITWIEPSKSTMNDMIYSSFDGGERESAFEPLLHNLGLLWEKYVQSVSSGMVDCLSVSHLGMILQHLADAETKKVNRKMPSSFLQGVPNLLLCRKEALLYTVLAIYNDDENIESPLPLPEEVLLCTSQTTKEEIDIFLRRSLYDSRGKIYCLVNADCLSYEVADHSEHRLEHHIKKAQNKFYNLIIVCDVEREFQSRIVAALDKHKRSGLPVDVGKIRSMLKEKLKNESENVAAFADWERSTVRVIKSWRAGVGKTLFKKRVAEDVERMHCSQENNAVISISFHERDFKVDDVMKKLLDNTLPPERIEPRLIHIDFSHEVENGLDFFLFQLLVIGCLTNSYGLVWRKKDFDMYVIETMPIRTGETDEKTQTVECRHSCFNILPDAICRSPLESLKILERNIPDFRERGILFDQREFESEYFQRPFQYLSQHDVNVQRVNGTPKECLETLLQHCGIQDPSWAELRNFVWFLNTQLKDYENSVFISFSDEETLPDFPKFVLQFLIQMSRDFSTRSLQMSEEGTDNQSAHGHSFTSEEENAVLRQYQMKRTWESSPHPYLFFNADHTSMTFVGFNVNRFSGDILDHRTDKVLSEVKMPYDLYRALERNCVDLNEDFDKLQRMEKIKKLYSVMGIDIQSEEDNSEYDPDPTYELTTDNVKKILAVYMRFRSDIPVVIMGETGCGKTRLVKFLCDIGLKRKPKKEKCSEDTNKTNMIIMKVHGGTTSNDIKRKVVEAEILTEKNIEIYGDNMFTVLFLDEANTTEAIGTIKEIMCDRTIGGEPLRLGRSLKIVAACNPYKRHSDELIKKLEQAGLGYHVDADKTTDRIGRLPMRRLVYRVQPLPQSMIPLVWDFGQLSPDVEKLYIRQMVIRYINQNKLPVGLEDVVSSVLTASQVFMREEKDQCSFVSLRDVERVLDVMAWFYSQSQTEEDIFRFKTNEFDSDSKTDSNDDIEFKVGRKKHILFHMIIFQPLNPETLSLIMAIGVCYHACLMDRKSYRDYVSESFQEPCQLSGGPDRILHEINRCQTILLGNIDLGKNIAKNQALQENLFMMVISIELRIPLFLVGKPGSSKSMAKTIVADAMQGTSAHSPFFKKFKQAQMVSFQCSPLSVPEGIVGTFRQCAMYQKDKDLNRFVSVVVLDEVGLAEDSSKMPLKALHSLLEDGCQDDDTIEMYRKVAFIGISNWALDPAKMNRGLLVQRDVPDKKELIESAKGIMKTDQSIKFQVIQTLLQPLADSYLQVFEHFHTKREFFGLRDFYSLIKMLYGYCAKKDPTWYILQHCVLRNFSGFDISERTPWGIFEANLQPLFDDSSKQVDDPDCSPAGLIEACLRGDQFDSDTRYLLLLTESYGALWILQQKLLTIQNATTIFGSNFPSDQEYTQVCRNINKIKVCMEAGTTVVLLNLENLYESLYDALNQCYVYFGGERYVDLGLGSHRVKCRVHKDFRLIVVAEKDTVYRQFPIPLINRLEKHFLNISTLL